MDANLLVSVEKDIFDPKSLCEFSSIFHKESIDKDT